MSVLQTYNNSQEIHIIRLLNEDNIDEAELEFTNQQKEFIKKRCIDQNILEKVNRKEKKIFFKYFYPSFFLAEPYYWRQYELDTLTGNALLSFFKTWFQEHQESVIAQLILEDDILKAQKKFSKELNPNRSFNICALIKHVDIKIENFIKKNWDLLINYLSNPTMLQKLSVPEKLTLLEYFSSRLKVLPQLSEYMHHPKSSDTMFAPRGIQIIIDYLTNKESPSLCKEDHITVCKDFKTFTRELQILAQDPNIQDGYIHLFIVSHIEECKCPIARHVTTLMTKRVEGSWEFIILDSATSADTRATYCKPLISIIEQVENTIPDQLPIRHIHINEYPRQSRYDRHNCAVFAVRDLVYLSRYGSGFLKTLSSSASTKINYFTNLPPECMKTTQFVNRLLTYIENRKASNQSTEMLCQKSPSGIETLEENFERHKQVSPSDNKALNSLIHKRAIKYKRIITESLFSNCLKKL
ncbi:MAG: hypothetical protein V4494_06765 [Chlamydiota bacterium]